MSPSPNFNGNLGKRSLAPDNPKCPLSPTPRGFRGEGDLASNQTSFRENSPCNMATSVLSAVSISRRAAAFLPRARRCASRPAAAAFASQSQARFYSNDRSSSGSRLTERQPNAYDKWILTIYKKYPKGQVPDFVPVAVIEKSRNKARIHLNLIMAALTLMGAFLAATWGRRHQERGDSLTKMNMEWHEKQKGS